MREKPDHYTDKAKRAGYVARSVYKLDEIQQKNRVLSRGDKVLDLGAAPGSWTQRALEIVGEAGAVCAVDLEPLSVADSGNLTSLTEDLFSEALEEQLTAHSPFDALLCDAAPATSGNRGLDATRSAAIVERCLQLCGWYLKENGAMVAKLFQGSDEQHLRAEVQRLFRKGKTEKPKACRKDSAEIYLVGLGFRPEMAEAQ
jgi:23S rRNA (uridine2552-2'-O)-methyltransferase